MSNTSKAIKALTRANKKEEIPTIEEVSEINHILSQLIMLMNHEESSDEESSDEESSDEESSCEEVTNVECSDDESSDEESCSGESCDTESSGRRSYKKGPRSKGYTLYIENGGTRAKWSDKSDKYKDNYYSRHSN